MAGFLDAFNSDDGKLGIALLAAAGPSMQPMSFGQRLAGAMQSLDADRAEQAKLGLLNAQIGNFKSEIAARDVAAQKQADGLKFMQGLLGQSGGYAPGQLGSGTMGIVPNANPLAPPPQRGLAAATPEQIAAAKLYGFDLMEPWKIAKEGFEQKAGTYRVDPSSGRREYVPDPTKGITMDASGRVGVMPGFADATTATTLATEAPKALLNAAGTLNLRKNADGTESPVSALSENPILQNVLNSLSGGRMNIGAPTAAPSQVPPAGSPGRPMVSAAEQATRDQEAIRIRQEELKNPNLPPADRAAIENELARMQGGKPAYGVSTAQQIRNDADKETAIQRAKDIAEQRKGIMSAGFNAPTNIARYQKIGQLLQDVDGGKYTPQGKEFASALNSFGLKIDKNLSNKEAAESLANQAALELRNPAGGAGMPGAMSDADREYLKSMVPNLAQSSQGRKQVIDSYVAVQQRNQQVADFARKYEQKYGKLDNGFFDQLQQWSNANPLFKVK